MNWYMPALLISLDLNVQIRVCWDGSTAIRNILIRSVWGSFSDVRI